MTLSTEVMACSTEVKGTKTIRLFDPTEEEPRRVLLSSGASITDLPTTVLRVETAIQGQGAAVRAEPDLIDFRDEERSLVGDSLNEASSACEFMTQTAESFGYGHGCMMTVANPLAYIPVGERVPVVLLSHSERATEGTVSLPVGEDGEGTEVSIQEVILADIVNGMGHTRSVAEVGVRTHDEARRWAYRQKPSRRWWGTADR